MHAASLADGRSVVVKGLRPDIRVRSARDIALLRGIGELVDRVHPNADKIRPLDVVAELELTLRNELDLQRAGCQRQPVAAQFPRFR
ncbi:AarF/UbiB family protein [Dokdonella sp.]|uniref:AarF/UbiB family protein n=1 Tax=Dokdonella sp. TaxID=2291710 RepID=UPI0025B9ACBD|nr:AarF/UbiB family protein [Dokdonella sp.]